MSMNEQAQIDQMDVESKSVAVDGGKQYLTFSLNKEIYGVNINEVLEIINLRNIARVPMMPRQIAGVINLRGRVVPVIDLALRFEQNPSKRTKRSGIVIFEVQGEKGNVDIGATVDEVIEVVNLADDDIGESPDFGSIIRPDFIRGMGKFDTHLLVLLEMKKVLSIDELATLDIVH